MNDVKDLSEQEIKDICRKRNVGYDKLMDLRARKNISWKGEAARDKVMVLLKMKPGQKDQATRYVKLLRELEGCGFGTDITKAWKCYYDDCQSAGRSEGRFETLETGFQHFRKALPDITFIEEIKRNKDVNHIRVFRDYLTNPKPEGQGMKPNTTNTLMCVIRAFFYWCEREGYSLNTKQLFAKMIPKIEIVKKKILTEDEISKLLASITKPDESLFIRALYSCGARGEEIVNMKVKDVSLTERVIRKPFGSHKKVKEEEFAHIDQTTYDRIIESIKGRQPDDYLFLIDGQPVTKTGGAAALKKWCKIAGVPVVTKHTLRASYAVHIMKAGLSNSLVMKLVGWKNPATIQHYMQFVTGDLTEVYDRAHLLARNENNNKITEVKAEI